MEPPTSKVNSRFPSTKCIHTSWRTTNTSKQIDIELTSERMQSLVQQRPSSAQDDEWQQEVEDHVRRILSQYRVETHVNHTPPDDASCSLRLSADVLERLQSLGLVSLSFTHSSPR